MALPSLLPMGCEHPVSCPHPAAKAPTPLSYWAPLGHPSPNVCTGKRQGLQPRVPWADLGSCPGAGPTPRPTRYSQGGGIKWEKMGGPVCKGPFAQKGLEVPSSEQNRLFGHTFCLRTPELPGRNLGGLEFLPSK